MEKLVEKFLKESYTSNIDKFLDILVEELCLVLNIKDSQRITTLAYQKTITGSLKSFYRELNKLYGIPLEDFNDIVKIATNRYNKL